jgi:phospholipid/cholesterol/gamma-HCH transport system substrate-binding protein
MRPRTIAIYAVLGSALVAAGATGLARANGVFSGDYPYRVKVRFDDTQGLVTGSRVSIAGVPAGQVQALTVDDRDKVAVATLGVTDSVRPILDDTEAVIRPRGLAGEKFLELRLGTRGKPVPSGGWLQGKGNPTVELEDIADSFDAPTRAGLKSFLDELGAGMVGNGPTANQDIGELLTLVDRSEGLATTLQAQNDDIGALLANLDTVVSALNGLQQQGAVLDQFAGNATTVSTAVADRDVQLRAMLQRLGTVLDELGRAVSGHEGQFRDGLQRLPGLETKLQGLLHDLDPTLTGIQADMPTVESLLAQLADGTWGPYPEGNRLTLTATGSERLVSPGAGASSPADPDIMRFLTGGR